MKELVVAVVGFGVDIDVVVITNLTLSARMMAAQTNPRVASCHLIVCRCCTRSAKVLDDVGDGDGNGDGDGEGDVTAFTNVVVDDASVSVRLVPWRNVHSQQTFPLENGKFSFLPMSFTLEFYFCPRLSINFMFW